MKVKHKTNLSDLRVYYFILVKHKTNLSDLRADFIGSLHIRRHQFKFIRRRSNLVN